MHSVPCAISVDGSARQEQEERMLNSIDTEEKGLKHIGFILLG